MGMRTAACLAAAWILLSGADDPGRSMSVRLGQTANLGTLRVTPQQVIEDSRCPEAQACALPGRLRVRALVDTPQGSQSRELTLGKVERMAGGQLVVEAVRPQPRAGAAIAPGDYRFTIRFRPPF